MKWIILAIIAQSLDASLTCYKLSQEGMRELNPLFSQSCTRVIVVKSISQTPLLFLRGKNQKFYASAMIISGSVGITFTLILSK